MEIFKLDGKDKRLYSLVAHLVMDEEVLACNLNYPFRTSPQYCWFELCENAPVKSHPRKYEERL